MTRPVFVIVYRDVTHRDRAYSADVKTYKTIKQIIPIYIVSCAIRRLSVVLAPSSPQLPMLEALDVCRDPEGWGPISSIRKFDLTFCFEEGALLAPILALWAVSSAARIYGLSSLEKKQRSRKSLWVLGIKLVSVVGGYRC